MPFHTLHVTLQAIRNKQRLPLLTTKTAIRQINPIRPRHNSRFWRPVCIDNKHRAQTRMTHKQAALLVHRQAIRSHGAKTLKENSDFARRPVGMKGQSPDRVGPCHGDEKEFFVGRKYEPVGTYPVVYECVKFSGRREPVDFAGGVSHSGLALICEVEVALGAEY